MPMRRPVALRRSRRPVTISRTRFHLKCRGSDGAAMLPAAIRDKAKTLFLISLGSDAEGERQAASTALKRLLKSNGLDLHDMAGALVEEPPPPPTSPPARPEPRIKEHGDGRWEIPSAD